MRDSHNLDDVYSNGTHWTCMKKDSCSATTPKGDNKKIYIDSYMKLVFLLSYCVKIYAMNTIQTSKEPLIHISQTTKDKIIFSI